jgi:hypothetical protein
MAASKEIGVLLPLIVAALISVSGCIQAEPYAVYPHIEPAEGPSLDHITYEYRYMEGQVSLTIPVDASVYWGAKNADKQAHIHGEMEDEEWLPGYYRSFITEGDLFPLYDAIGDACSQLRIENNLDDDEYLELITVFVQSIPYSEGNTPISPKFPIETIVDGEGDCDDKSILLAALLAREGYDVVLFYFEKENHMAVGIRCPQWSYKDTGYAFIETTGINLVGFETEELQGGDILVSDPVLIPVGEGELQYHRCDQTRYIQDAYLASKVQAKDLKSRLETMPPSGVAYNRLIARYNGVVELHNYITLNQHARGHLYTWVREWETTH